MAPRLSCVLLVDDDEGIRDALSETLSEEGFSVATAANGREAILWLQERRPQSCVVLLDLMMPIMDGSEFLRAKQADAALCEIPVVILTAAGARFRVDGSPDIKDTVSKPIELPHLMAAIESCLA